ncbi:MAG TPA: thiamine phosphate synthase [Terriglobales bacterium]|jgi:thiamine-phosphate pyrophosphorylase|nr:thiamine phosphate synthase [Terriglobales bacterium]
MADRCLLYYITDRSQFRGDEHARRRALLAKVSEAARAGVEYIHLREKDLSARELEMLARDALAAVRNSVPLRTENRELSTGPELRTRLLINSRTDVALAVGADGVHLRADDITPDEVRQVLNASAHRSLPADHFLVAASCHTAADVFHAESEAADFAVFAPVFGKSSAPGTRPTGLAALHEACRAKIPVFALGGVTIENAASCLRAGAAGVAAIRLFQENKIEDVVRALRAL